MRRVFVSFVSMVALLGIGGGQSLASPADGIGEHGRAGGIAVQSDGRMLVSGTTSGYQGFVVRLKPGGEIDPTFGRGGIANGLGRAFDGGQLLVQPDQKILVLTSGASGSSPELSRLNPDGSRDTTFAGGNTVEIPGFGKLALQADGKILYAGTDLSCFRMCLLGSSLVRRYNPDGTIDAGFGNNGIARFGTRDDKTHFNDVAIDDAGRILAVEEQNLVRFEPDGTLDPSFGTLGAVPLGLFTGTKLSYRSGVITLGGLTGNPLERKFTVRTLGDDGVFNPGYGDGGSAVPSTGPDPITVAMLDRGDGTLGIFTERSFDCATETDCERGPSISLLNQTGTEVNWPSGPAASADLGLGSVVSEGLFQPDGKAVVLADQTTVLSDDDHFTKISVVRFGQDGTLDAGFGSDGIATFPEFTCRGQEARYAAPEVGTWWNGTAKRDVVKGSPRSDWIRGRGAGDILCGGNGRDRIFGQNGPDVLVGGPGRDVLNGGPGNDRILARDGYRDVVRCGAGRKDVAIVDRKDVVRGCEKVKRPGRG